MDEDRALDWDSALQQWADEQISHSPSDSPELSAKMLLNELQVDVKGVAGLSAGVFRSAGTIDDFETEFRDWLELREEAYTHVAIVIRRPDEAVHVDVWAVLVQRLKKFSPENLSNKGLQQFHHECASCAHNYNGQFYGGDRILLLQCPKCEQHYDILAVNRKSNYARANAFFSRINPAVAMPAQISEYDLMRRIWRSVLDHCSYENDYDVRSLGPAKDCWQTSAEKISCTSLRQRR